MSKVYRVGVIGCGGIANGKHLPALSRQDKVQVVAFCDIIKERAKRLLNNSAVRKQLSTWTIRNY